MGEMKKSQSDNYPSLKKLIGSRDLLFLESVANSIGVSSNRNANVLCDRILNLEKDNDKEKKQFIFNLWNFKKTYFPFIQQTTESITNRLNLFLNNFTKLTNVNEVVNGIKLLNILLSNYKYHFMNLKPLEVNNKEPFKEDRVLRNIFEKWLNDLKVEYPSVYVNKSNQEFKNAIQELIARKLYNKPESSMVYGSFSLYLYDKTVKFNDIDLYATDTYHYLICLIGIVYFSTGRELSINSIPYVEGLRTIRDETKYEDNEYIENNLLDCIHMDKSIFAHLPFISYDNVKILDPKIQFLQTIRQLSVFDRRHKLYYDFDKVLKSLLYYTYISKVDFKIRAIPSTEWFFRKNNKYENISELKKSDDNLLYLLFKEPSYFKIIIDGVTYITIINYNHSNKVNIDSFVYTLFSILKKKSMKYGSVFNEDVYEGKNIVVFTHNTLETYFTKDYELTILTIISFISTYALYNLLHKRNIDNLLNLIYTLMQQKMNQSHWKIERYKNTKESHKVINFVKLLFTSLIAKEEPNEFIEKNNSNGMLKTNKN